MAAHSFRNGQWTGTTVLSCVPKKCLPLKISSATITYRLPTGGPSCYQNPLPSSHFRTTTALRHYLLTILKPGMLVVMTQAYTISFRVGGRDHHTYHNRIKAGTQGTFVSYSGYNFKLLMDVDFHGGPYLSIALGR